MTTAAHLYHVLRRIRPLHELSARAVTDALDGRDITMPMRAVLERLHDAGPQTVPAIARWLWVSRQGVQVIVDQARRRGLVENRPNPQHRRSHLITLTEAGRSSFTQIHDEELASLAGLAQDLEEADVEACLRVLDHLIDRLATRTSRSGEETDG